MNWAAGEHRSTTIRALNPRPQLPILSDGEHVIWDRQAILTYLARRYGEEHWLPLDANGLSSVVRWKMLAIRPDCGTAERVTASAPQVTFGK